MVVSSHDCQTSFIIHVIQVLQVCLMSQSWDTEHYLQHAMYSAHAQMKGAPNFEPMLLWCRPHPSLQAKSSCSNSPCMQSMATFSLRSNVESTTKPWSTKSRYRLSLRSRLGGLLSRPVERTEHAQFVDVLRLIMGIYSFYLHTGSMTTPTN